MYYSILTQFTQALKNLDAWLDKAEKHAAEKKFDISVILTSRLAPDMRDLIYQVQSACDYVKSGAAWLSEQKPPRHEDNEKTLADVRERIRKTIAFAESVKEEQYAASKHQRVQMSWMPGKVLEGRDYLIQMIIPSVYFHLCIAYALLRHNGVEIGKMDYLGPVKFVEGKPTVT